MCNVNRHFILSYAVRRPNVCPSNDKPTLNKASKCLEKAAVLQLWVAFFLNVSLPIYDLSPKICVVHSMSLCVMRRSKSSPNEMTEEGIRQLNVHQMTHKLKLANTFARGNIIHSGSGLLIINTRTPGIWLWWVLFYQQPTVILKVRKLFSDR